MDLALLSCFLLSPLFGAAACILLIPRWAAAFSLLIGTTNCLIAFYLWTTVNPAILTPALFLSFPWILDLSDYLLAVDGLNIGFLVLSQILGLIALWQNRRTSYRFSTACLLVIQTAWTIAFTSVDLLLTASAVSVGCLAGFLLLQGEQEDEIPRSVVAFTVASNTLLLCGALILGACHFFYFSFFSTRFFDLLKLTPILSTSPGLAALSGLGLGMLVVSILGLAGSFPTHIWMPRFLMLNSLPAKTWRLGAGILFPAYFWIHWILPMFLDPHSKILLTVATFSAFGSLYCSIVALNSKDLTQWLAAVAATFGSFTAFGMAINRPQTIYGSILFAFAGALVCIGLLALIDRFSRVFASTQPFEISCLLRANKKCAIILAVLLLVTLGVPGSPFFGAYLLTVAESFATLPAPTFCVGLAFCIVGFSVFRLFLPLFSGESPYRELEKKPDLTQRSFSLYLALLIPLAFLAIRPSAVHEKITPLLKHFSKYAPEAER